MMNASIPFAQNAPEAAIDRAAIRNHAAKLLHHITKSEALISAGADDSGELAEARRHMVACANGFDCFIDPMDGAAQARTATGD